MTTTYLIDPTGGMTGYAQIIEEYVDMKLARTYTLGHDVLTQANTADDPVAQGLFHLLYDGHGSTRALMDAAALVIQRYAYDAYGVMLDGATLTTAANAATSLLYSGEWTSKNGQQYLRARWYNPESGRFNRVDPFAGVLANPISLNKYLYGHSNSIINVDPSGQAILQAVVGTLVVLGVISVVSLVNYVTFPAINYLTSPSPSPIPTPQRRTLLKQFAIIQGNAARAGLYTDVEAMARLAEEIARYHTGLYRDDEKAFVDDFSAIAGGVEVVPPNLRPIPINTYYADKVFQQTGFHQDFLDPHSTANQVRHFATFVSMGYHWGFQAARISSVIAEVESPQGNLGDVYLGIRGATLGTSIQVFGGTSSISLLDTGVWIRNNLVTPGSWRR